MENRTDLKDIVREKYGEIARRSERASSSCCGPGCGCSGDTIMADSYTALEGYVAEADLGLGCGIPTDGAGIRAGDVVLDLGSGAGNDVFVARRLVGEHGRVIGVDFTPAMVEKAESNRRKLGYENVEFRLGDIEELPVESGSVNVVISNCVLNLVPEKSKAFEQIFRVLKPGGHFSISDIVVSAPLPPALRSVAELYAGCVAGAVERREYIRLIESAGFRTVRIIKEKQITIPEEDLRTLVSPADLEAYYSSGAKIESITVVGEKPQ